MERTKETLDLRVQCGFFFDSRTLHNYPFDSRMVLGMKECHHLGPVGTLGEKHSHST